MSSLRHVCVTAKQHQYLLFMRAEKELTSFNAVIQYLINVEREHNNERK